MLQVQGYIGDVNTLCEKVAASHAGADFLLKDDIIRPKKGNASSSGPPSWQHTNTHIGRNDLTQSNIAAGLYSLGSLPDEAVVHTISGGADKSVSGGTLMLPPNHNIVLDETWDMKFTRVTITGMRHNM